MLYYIYDIISLFYVIDIMSLSFWIHMNTEERHDCTSQSPSRRHSADLRGSLKELNEALEVRGWSDLLRVHGWRVKTDLLLVSARLTMFAAPKSKIAELSEKGLWFGFRLEVGSSISLLNCSLFSRDIFQVPLLLYVDGVMAQLPLEACPCLR